jgi:hypothetical protein
MAELRRCIGSERFGIVAHDAPPEDFPAQPSQKDGLGRMCKPHWNQYTAGLARDRKARKLLGTAEPTVQSQAAARVATKRAARVATAGKKPEPIRTRAARARKTEGEQIVEAVDAAIAREAASIT